MTSSLSICLFGPVEVRLDGEPVSGFEYNKVRALLIYLAVEAGRPHTRASLCALLWAEMPENTARQNLSQALSQLRKVLKEKQSSTSYLLTNPESVQLNPAASVEVDIARFLTLISTAETHPHRDWRLCSRCARQLSQAVSLYRGDLLAHFYVSDSASFEEWALLLRERLRQHMLSALERLVRYFEWRGAYEQAVEMARKHVEMEPWQDNNHRELMRLLALSGQRSAALAQYAHLKRMLNAELDIEPEPETVGLFEKIRATESLDSLRRLQPPTSKLPSPPTSLIGRTMDLDVVTGLLNDGVRLLTITGAPGVGKTRFTLEIATQLRYDFEDGACFVDLVSAPDATHVPSAVAQALGVKEQAGRTLVESVQGHLRYKHLLLVLDNFEHVIEAAPFVADLLAACPELKVLVTSRSALRLRAEHIHLLISLETAEAVQLFTERARGVQPGFALTEDNAATIAALCRQLDNLPLGIELVAVRMRTFSAAELLRQLGPRLGAQPAGSRDLPERQRTLRNAIAWSYDRLRADEQIVFAHLGVFLGGCTVEAVQAVVAESLPIPLLLEALVEASLVQSRTIENETRFTLLETIREFALEQLAARGEADAARQRHAAYFLALAELAVPELIGPNQKNWFDRLDRELANLRAALSWSLSHAIETQLRLATALEHFWMVRGRSMEGRTWLKQALLLSSQAGGPQTEIHAKARLVAGVLASKQGDYAEANELLIQSRHFFMQTENETGLARVFLYLGVIAEGQAEYPTARNFFQESLELARELQDWYTQAGALKGLAYTAIRQGDHTLARFYDEQALGLYQTHHSVRDMAGLTLNLGISSYEQGDYDVARRHTETALAAAREFGDNYLITLSLLNLGNILVAMGDYTAARLHLEESIAIQRARGDTEYLSAPLGTLGRALYKLGEVSKARACQIEALTLRVTAGERRGVAVSLENLAPIELAQGRPARAVRFLGASDTIREAIGSPIIPARRLEYEQVVNAARAALGEEGFARAWAEGRALTLEQVVALALHDATTPSSQG